MMLSNQIFANPGLRMSGVSAVTHVPWLGAAYGRIADKPVLMGLLAGGPRERRAAFPNITDLCRSDSQRAFDPLI